MREILFRGKDRNTGEWRYFDLFDTDMHYVEHDTIGQYTGLEDCTGAMRIYEGDILKDTVYGATAIVEWQGCGFVARLKHGKYGVEIPLTKVNDEWKVVSNIHDERPVEG